LLKHLYTTSMWCCSPALATLSNDKGKHRVAAWLVCKPLQPWTANLLCRGLLSRFAGVCCLVFHTSVRLADPTSAGVCLRCLQP
jgi:hypothetical protein